MSIQYAYNYGFAAFKRYCERLIVSHLTDGIAVVPLERRVMLSKIDAIPGNDVAIRVMFGLNYSDNLPPVHAAILNAAPAFILNFTSH